MPLHRHMRLIFYLRQLLVAALVPGHLPAAYASHILGGDIAYTPVAATTAGVPRYHITVRLYRDPAGGDQRDVTLTCSRDGCAASSSGSFTRVLPRTSVEHVALTCGGFGQKNDTYQTYLFETEKDLPPAQAATMPQWPCLIMPAR